MDDPAGERRYGGGDQGVVFTVGAAEGEETNKDAIVENGGTSVPDSPMGASGTRDGGADHIVSDLNGDEEITVFCDALAVVTGEETRAEQVTVGPDHVLLLKEERLVISSFGKKQI